MACKNVCRLCDNLIISTGVTFTGGTLAIDIPAGNYADGGKYCIVVAQSIPAEATITAPVVITIGGVTTTTYPLLDKCCKQITASQISVRTRYSTRVSTTATGGSFKMLGCIQSNANVLASIPAPTA